MRILVADDHEVVRCGVRALLEREPGWQICAEAGTGREAVAQAVAATPDVAVLDVMMPDLNGIEATRRIRRQVPRCEVLILTMHESEQVFREAMGAGARGYVLKTDAARNLVAAVDALAHHRPFLAPRAATLVLDDYLLREERGARGGSSTARLTAREREIVQLLAEGRSTKEVARTLEISPKTAETHRTNLMRKLDLHSLSELVRYAIRNNLIQA